MLIAFAVLIINASGFVEPSITRSLADEVIEYRYQDAEFSREESFVDLAGIPSARAYIYRLGDASLDPSREYDSGDSSWGVDRYVTVITGARYSENPVMEVSNCLPAWEANRLQAEEKAHDLWQGLEPQITGYVYLAPLDEWFEVTTTAGKRYLHSRELREYDLSKLESPRSTIENISENSSWQHVLSGDFALAAKSNKIADVPYALWSYGCSPTASSMILDYWDRRGYPLLVDCYFDRWDNVEQETDIDLTNAHRELATGMHTDSVVHGGTSTSNITPGNLYVTNSVHSYAFTGSTISSSNSVNFGAVINEIDKGRPVHWSVGNYLYGGDAIYHSICAIGYEISESNDSFIVIHNTWDKAEHSWAYQTTGSYSDVYPLIPGGSVSEDLRLKSFVSGGNYYKGIKYPLMWQKAGNVTSVKVWLAGSDIHSTWQLLADSDDGNDFVLIDMSADFSGKRLNIEGYSGSKLVAADGTPSKIGPRDFPSVEHFTARGHVFTQGYPMGRSVISGNTAFVMQGTSRVMVVELADDYLLPRIVLSPHLISDLAVDGDYLYLLGNDSLTLYDIKDPSSPVLKSTVGLSASYSSIAAYSGFVYLGSQYSPLLTMRCENNQFSDEESIPESTVTSLDVIGGKLYVSAGSKGVSVYDLSTPGAPSFEKNVSTKYAPAGVAKYNNTLVVNEGYGGFEMIDLSTGASKVVAVGTVADLAVAADRIFVAAEQSGLFVYKINGATSANQIGQFSSLSGSKLGVSLGKYLYLGCGFDGFFALETDLVGIEEPVQPPQELSFNVTSLIRRGTSLGSVTLTASSDVQVLLYDVGGRKVMSQSVSYKSGLNALPVVPDDLASGVYFVKVISPGDSFKAKVVVTN